MRNLFENWRGFTRNILNEQRYAVDPADVPLRKHAYATEVGLLGDPFPIIDWAQKNNFVVREIDPERLPSFLGEGAQGRVYAVVKGGREYAVKLTPTDGFGAENEKNMVKKISQLRDSLPPDVARHIAHFYDLKRPIFRDESGRAFNVYLMDILSPLTDKEKEMAAGKEIDVAGNAFWDDNQWDLTRDIIEDIVNRSFVEKLSNAIVYDGNIDDGNIDVGVEEVEEKLKKMSARLMDAIFKARHYFSKKDINKLQNRYDQRGKNVDAISIPFAGALNKTLLKTSEARSIIEELSVVANRDLYNTFFDYFVDLGKEIGKAVFVPQFREVLSNDKWAKRAEMLKPGPAKSFFLALNKLNTYGIVPNDVHMDNIMKKDNNWVIADIGLFQEK